MRREIIIKGLNKMNTQSKRRSLASVQTFARGRSEFRNETFVAPLLNTFADIHFNLNSTE